MTSPVKGINKSETVLTASTDPKTSPSSTVSSNVSTSTYTISPNSPWAKSVIPIVAMSFSILIHSWSFVYFKSDRYIHIFYIFNFLLSCKQY